MGSYEDRIRLAVFYRREQLRIFEALITVYANSISVNKDIGGKIESIINDYIELIVPGSNEFRKHAQENYIKKQGEALQAIFDAFRKPKT